MKIVEIFVGVNAVLSIAVIVGTKIGWNKMKKLGRKIQDDIDGYNH